MSLTARQKQYLDLVKTEPVMFGKWNGFNELVELHNRWIKDFLFKTEDQTTLAHRGSYKTTCLEIAIALMLIIYPSKSIIFLRKTDTDVQEVLNTVQKLLQSDTYRELAMALYNNDLELTRANASEVSTNLKKGNRGAPQLMGLGINTSITGKHADIVITDDIVNINDRISFTEREKTKRQYQELQNVKNRGGRFINTGTPWHKEDAISTYMPNIKRFDVYSTGLVTKEEIAHLQQSMTPSLFAANYELKHIADLDALFSAPTYSDDVTEIYNGVGHIDAAFGGADSTAYTGIREFSDGSMVAVGKLWHKHVDDCLDDIEALHRSLRLGTINLETNADKGYLAAHLKNRGLQVRTYHESENKFIKISTYLRKYWSDMRWLDITDRDYMEQVLDYTEQAEHDDAPDSAASLVRAIKSRKKWLI